ncbi:hypothetical protein KSS87_011987 [Heliosperma pusillum]|nr:hypothetical protein KSS87_011987 [Heliosperma pusillum]
MAGNGVFGDIIEGEVYKYYADGQWKTSSSSKSVPIINPTTRKTQFKVQEEGVRILGEGKFLVSDSFPGNDRTKYCLTSKIPLGLVLAIPPFNYPVNLAVSKIAPALIAGNSLVLKPPTQGAVAALHMVHCFHLAGFPKGLISCVTGKGSEIGDFLTMHPGVNCISFTGGDTGIAISKKAGMIPLQMELGGKDACIVLEDADLDLVAANIVKGGFSYSGQRCTAVKVVLVMDSVAETLVEKVKAKVAKLTVGPPEEDCDITPVVTESSANFIEGLVKDAKEKGATFCQEYKREGNLIWPLLLDNVRPDMRIAWEEPFGPVLPVIRINSVEEGIHHCNASNFGLQGCVFTKDINKAMLISDAMESGTVQINSAPARGPDHFPFQGIKDSGIGSQGITNSINMMTKTKSTVINLPTPSYTMGSRPTHLGAIVGTLHPTVAPLLLDANTSHDAWLLLEHTYVNSSRGHILQIKDKLKNITLGDKSITDYVLSIKSCIDQLAQLGKNFQKAESESFDRLVGIAKIFLAEYGLKKDVIRAFFHLNEEEIRSRIRKSTMEGEPSSKLG